MMKSVNLILALGFLVATNNAFGKTVTVCEKFDSHAVQVWGAPAVAPLLVHPKLQLMVEVHTAAPDDIKIATHGLTTDKYLGFKSTNTSIYFQDPLPYLPAPRIEYIEFDYDAMGNEDAVITVTKADFTTETMIIPAHSGGMLKFEDVLMIRFQEGDREHVIDNMCITFRYSGKTKNSH